MEKYYVTELCEQKHTQIYHVTLSLQNQANNHLQFVLRLILCVTHEWACVWFYEYLEDDLKLSFIKNLKSHH